MASYAALLSLFHTINHINIHPRPPISIDQQQLQSLTQNLSFFQHFLESYSSEEDDHLENCITASAYAAEDVIESHIVDQIHSRSKYIRRVVSLIKNKVLKMLGAQIVAQIHTDLERVIQDMNLIKREAMEIIQQKMTRTQHHHLHTNPSVSAASTWQTSTYTSPVFDDAMINEVLDNLTGQQSSHQIIPIVEMGGIGKTTIARNIYKNQIIFHHFDFLAWVTISQQYSVPKILKQILCLGSEESVMSENELGERVHKMLWGRRYLIVMDDIWSIEALDKVRFFFPDNNNGSRLMITTRISNLAFKLSGCHVVQMKFLDEGRSWDLLCQIVFGKEDCPIELEDIGKDCNKM